MSIRTIFSEVINDEKIEVNKGVYVRIDVFERIFEGAKTYNDFIEIDNSEKGYKRFLDECKEKGLLN